MTLDNVFGFQMYHTSDKCDSEVIYFLQQGACCNIARRAVDEPLPSLVISRWIHSLLKVVFNLIALSLSFSNVKDQRATFLD